MDEDYPSREAFWPVPFIGETTIPRENDGISVLRGGKHQVIWLSFQANLSDILYLMTQCHKARGYGTWHIFID